MAWIIESAYDPELAWSNVWGWCSEDYDTFTDEERMTLNLPVGGRWVQVPWRIEDEE
jgi:hypothetical protein